jgi:hypothetical protein
MAPVARFQAVCNATIWQGIFKGSFGKDPERAKAPFLEHIAAVKAKVPAGQLLVYEVSQGWGPLCDFLGVPVPQQPFPHVNEAAAMKSTMGKINRAVAVVRTAAVVLPVLAVVLVAVRLR